MKNKITIKDRYEFLKIILCGKFKPFLKNEIDENIVSEVFYKLKKNLDKNNYKQKLINYLKKYYGSNNEVYLTSSGRNALFFILSNLKLRKKEVLIPSYSCLGLIEPVLNKELRPVFVDIDDNLNPSFKSIKKSISNRTGVVIIPHIGGTFARDTKKIIEYCKKRKIIVIEDCCQAFGLEYKKKKIGTFADISFFSSGIGKPVFTPEGGWIVIKKGIIKNFSFSELEHENYDEVYRRFSDFNKKFSNNPFHVLKRQIVDRLKSISKKNNPSFVNKKKKDLNNLSAYLILDQIKKHKENLTKRSKMANYWNKFIHINKNIKIITKNNSIYNKFFIYSDKVHKKAFLLSGVEVENGYVPLHLRYDFKKFIKTDLTNTNKIWEKIYSLPTRPSYTNNLT